MFINLLIYSAVHDAIVLVVKATYCEIKIVIFVFSDLGIFFTIFFIFFILEYIMNTLNIVHIFLMLILNPWDYANFCYNERKH